MLENNSNKAIIFGYSGHSFVIIDTLLDHEISITGYYEQQEQKYNPYHIKFLGVENDKNQSEINKNTIVFPGIGSNQIRKKLVEQFESNNLNQIVLKHKKSIVSKTCQIQHSTFIAAGAVINSFARIGKGCIINTSSVIEHECEIKDFTHIAPGAILAGNVRVGYESFIGANSVIKQGIIIGNKVTIGAGSVVLQNVPDNETWVGNPAKKMKK